MYVVMPVKNLEFTFRSPDGDAMNDIKAAQALETRRKLERVARKLFAERGFADVSAEEIVAKADLTRGALYHHYDGKEGLFEAIVDKLMQEVHAKLEKGASGAADPLQAVEDGIRVFLKVCTEPSTQRILLIDAPAILGWPKWREMDAKYGFGLLKRALVGAMQVSLIRKQNVDLLAHILFGALTEAAMVVVRSNDPVKARAEAERALASMLAGWRIPK
jgi:AcrR family transcriptional regulator